ncbi:MAG TPA: hypothetical protein VFG51_02495 [Candidatus Saccharimonadia bacterium]|nr:hypothetical protein [Candidatus Saccharimonadia bacterium]
MLKSIGAVISGIIVIVVLSVATDLLLQMVGVYPQGAASSGFLAIALFYRTVFALFGGLVTAKLAPTNPAKHVRVLLIIGTILGILGAVGGWNLSQHWYPISLVITSAIAVWYGGKLGLKSKK